MTKCVFITGGTVGTGYATAEKFAEAGYGVFIASRSAERAQEAANKIAAKYGVHAKGYGLGIRDEEAVKAVLENQIMQLQDKFDQQNIKVEAIEISVATHGFEQNLQQGEEKDTYEEENPRPRVRKIDINSLDAVDELPEEDQVVAEMMQLHGNSIDYMA